MIHYFGCTDFLRKTKTVNFNIERSELQKYLPNIEDARRIIREFTPPPEEEEEQFDKQLNFDPEQSEFDENYFSENLS